MEVYAKFFFFDRKSFIYDMVMNDMVSLKVTEGNDDLPPSLVVLWQMPADHLGQPHDVPDFLK